MVKVTAGVPYYTFAFIAVAAYWFYVPHERLTYYVFMFFTIYVLSAFIVLGAKIGYNKIRN